MSVRAVFGVLELTLALALTSCLGGDHMWQLSPVPRLYDHRHNQLFVRNDDHCKNYEFQTWWSIFRDCRGGLEDLKLSVVKKI